MTTESSRLTAAIADRYRLTREIGAGGMATVYLAHDLRHDRDVAIKVLHPELAAALGGERFLSEIRTTAKLQHPHILPLLDSGDANGLLYFVMPYVTGETLRARLERERQLPLDDALRIAREVADALGCAHASGIIHRDVKPENILLQGGHALVADFGIALAVQQAGGARMTQTGLSLGTPQYMSPEQAMGERTIDARSDVYALGAVTYEMLAGDPPFTGSSVQAIVAKVLSERPTPLRTVRDTVPEGVEHTVLTALAKLPADRFASAAEFAAALANPVARVAHGTTRARWLERHAMPVVIVLGVIALAASALAALRLPARGSADVNRFSIALGAAEDLSPLGGGSRVAWSPDGRAFAYVGLGIGGSGRLWLRRLDALSATLVAGTEGASSPFFSPDGRQIGFVTTTPFSLRTVPRAGGRATVLVSDGVSGGGADWSRDGWIYFDGASSLSRIRPDGTGREVVFQLDSLQREIGVAWPQALPGGRGVLCRVRRSGDDVGGYTIDVVDLKTRQRKQLVKATFARYVPSGHLLYVLSDGSLMAARFDLDRLEITGEGALIARGLGIGAFGAVDLAMASTGSLIYGTGRGIVTAVPVVWVGRDGTSTPVDSAWRNVFAGGIALSPDGSQLAVHLNAPSGGSTSRTEDIWIKQLPAGPMSRLTFEGEQNRRPSWSHDGRDVLFLSSRSGPSVLYRQRADGSAPARRIAATYSGLGGGTETPDGRWLILSSEVGTPGDGDILVMRLGVDSVPTPLLASGFQELAPAPSPDSRWLAYTSNETGRPEVYVRPFPDVSAGKVQVSTTGGIEPRWSHKGGELFYREPNGDFMSVRLRLAPTVAVLERKRLFSAIEYASSGGVHPMYDVSEDDRRFVMLRTGSSPSANGEAPQLVLVQNFVAELARTVP